MVSLALLLMPRKVACPAICSHPSSHVCMSGVHIPPLLLREGSSLQQVQTLARDKMEQADMRMQRNNHVCVPVP